MDIIQTIEETIQDSFLSNSEKTEIQEFIRDSHLSKGERIKLIQKSIQIASEKVDESNYAQVFKWLKKMSNILASYAVDDEHNTVYFSDVDNLRNELIRLIDAAKKTLDICVFTISDDPITNAISNAKNRGVNVKIITDDEKIMDLGSDIFKLKRRGISVKIDGSKSLMHHKFAVIDGTKVLSGSFNWTRSATEVNYENIIVSDDAGLINAFNKEFNRLWSSLENL